MRLWVQQVLRIPTGIVGFLLATLALLLLACPAGAGAQTNQHFANPEWQIFPDDDVDKLTELANKADAGAQYQLGTKYLHGRGVPKDVVRGLRWLRVSAAMGNRNARLELQRFDAGGVGTPTTSSALDASVAGITVGMTLPEVERVVAQHAQKGVAIKRTTIPRSTPYTPENVVGAVSTIRIGAECSWPRGADACEQITVFFARPDIGGKVRGVESLRNYPGSPDTRTIIDELQRVYGPFRKSHTYDRKLFDGEMKTTSLVWGGLSDRIEAKDAFFPINGSDGNRIGGKYVYAEVWQTPGGMVRRARVAAGDDELNSRQGAAWTAEHDRERDVERQAWRACVDKFLQEQQASAAAAPATSAVEEKKIFGYSGLGRVRFTLPGDLKYIPGVPHFTAGPRIMGGDGCRERFEVSVYSYREPQTPAKWRDELSTALRNSVPVTTLAGNDALLYATQTARTPDAEYRYVTYGVLAGGRALIRFEHFSNDESQASRDRLMRVVASAEFLDTDKWPAWDRIVQDEDAWKAVMQAYDKKDYRQSFAGAKQLCDQWTASRSDPDSRAVAGHACTQAADLILTETYLGAPPQYASAKAFLERALLAYGDASDFKEYRRVIYANLAAIHGLGLGVPENVVLARSYYAKEETLEHTLKARDEGKVGPRTTLLLKKLGY